MLGVGLRILRVLWLASLLGVAAAPAWGFQAVAAQHGMVVAAEPIAADVGVEILRAGGNAVDAAVAVGFALEVTYPQAGNIGGGGFMLIRRANGESVVVDYREEAPGGATRTMYLNAQGELIPQASTVGPLAAGVPGTVAGLVVAERKYGKLGLARVLAPAIRLARNGFPVSYAFSNALRGERELLTRFDGSRRIFLRDGRLYEAGEVFRQPELARTLSEIARRGTDGFYRGRVARALAVTMRKYHGLITPSDLEHYQAKIREPLHGQFRGYGILTVPPPSSGGVGLIEMLNILEPLDLGTPNSYASMHFIVEAMRRAYADRAAYLGDADFVKVPVAELTSPGYAERLRKEMLAARPDAPLEGGQLGRFEAAQTTHYSVVDADGTAVSNTYTLNGWFGCGVTVEGAGFLLNNEMDDFAARPGSPNMFGLVQGEANAIAAYKRPLSSMTPTIITQGDKPVLILGSPGGGTIINTVLQVTLNFLVGHLDVRQAVTAPRFHDQWMPDVLILEGHGFSADTVEKLQAEGYKVDYRDSLGDCEAIAVDPATGWRFGAADPRGEGKAVGY